MVFFVVFSDSWCATVPESWVNEGEKGVFWPHKKINATAACKKCFVPKRDWEHFTYTKLLGPYDTYDTARAVEMAAIDMSTCDEKSVQDVISEKLSKRQRKKPSRFQKSPNSSSHSDNDENNDNEDDEGFGADDALKKIVLPTFNYRGNDSGEKSPEQLVETQELDYGTFFYDHPSFKKQTVTGKPVIRSIESIKMPGFDAKKEKDVNKDCQIVKNVTQSSCLSKNETLNDPESTSTASTTAGSMEGTQNSNPINKSDAEAGSLSMKNDIGNTKVHTQPSVSNLTETVDGLTEKQSSTCHNCCPACRSILNSLSRKLDVVLNLHAENSQPHTTKQSHLLPEFPISTHEELTTFNKLLTDNKVARDQYTQMVQQRRSADGKKHIRTVLGYILTDDFCCKLSWSGQKKTIKVEDMSFVKYLKETVAASNSRCSLDDCKLAIMSWLQHASDRVKKSSNKHSTQ